MSSVAVISKTGKRLMPTSSYRARRLIKSGRATIYSYRPIFTIQLTDREDGDTQEIEYCCDTGYQHTGISIKSDQHAYVREQRDCLTDEVQKHEVQVGSEEPEVIISDTARQAAIIVRDRRSS
ncbi:MAG: RRXRR domain-containing protein [Solobacterium sp.]|jgi:hypothetical protein|nr:RRXRR domain-containing protein [Solobacterium sp.]